MPEKTVSAKQIGRILEVSVNDIIYNKNAFRSDLSEDNLSSLALSIKSVGIIEPLSVKVCGDKYELVSGERRLRAAIIAGFASVPCIAVKTNDCGSAVMRLVDNIQRNALHFLDEVRAINSLIYDYGLKRNAVCAYLGLSQSALSNKLRLLNLSEDLRDIILKNSLSERHARALLKLGSEGERREICGIIIERSLSVSATEALINQRLSGYKPRETVFVPKDVKLFLNTISSAVKTMRSAGIPADSQKRETDEYVEFVVRIPKIQENQNS